MNCARRFLQIFFDFPTAMLSAFRLTKKNAAVFSISITNPAVAAATYAHYLPKSCLLHHLLRRISSNTSSAPEISNLVSQSAPLESSVSSERLEKTPTLSSRKELSRDYTVSYLVESCGLSPKEALSASVKITTPFATPERPDSVLDILRSHGFTSTHITKIVRNYPQLLLTNADKIILPKLDFLQSMGLSNKDLARIVSYCPLILLRSLKKSIQPVCKFIKSFVHSDERVCTAIKQSPQLLMRDHTKFLEPNIALIQKLQVPPPFISYLLTHHPPVMVLNHEEFSAGVSKVKEMGFNPSKITFVMAVNALSGKNMRHIWDRCYKIYSTKWGWSEEDILSAFKKHPHCMTMSEKKIDSSMDLLVNTTGWSSKRIANRPVVLTYSLEKRMIPRCSVIRVLWAKGLLSKDINIGAIMNPVEKTFLKRYVTKYEEQVPQLLSVYKGETDALDLV